MGNVRYEIRSIINLKPHNDREPKNDHRDETRDTHYLMVLFVSQAIIGTTCKTWTWSLSNIISMLSCLVSLNICDDDIVDTKTLLYLKAMPGASHSMMPSSKQRRTSRIRLRPSRVVVFLCSMTCILLYISISIYLPMNSFEKRPVEFDFDPASSTGEHNLPKWVLDYFAWHKRVRQQFPGSALFKDSDAPPILIRTCLGLCGGLNDRLGQLPWDIYLANQTGRVLLIHWHRPAPLEHFLVTKRNWLDGSTGFRRIL